MFTQLAQSVEGEIRQLVAQEAAPFRIERIDIRVDEDADGEETIFVEIWHPLNDTPVETRQLLNVQFAVRQLLLKKRDGRFPWVRQHFAEGQRFESAA
jgi:hypothetical protein